LRIEHIEVDISGGVDAIFDAIFGNFVEDNSFDIWV